MVILATLAKPPSVAYAQTTQPTPVRSGMALGVGYQLLHIPDETFPFGLNVDVTAPLRGNVHVAGEFGFASDDQNEPGVSGNLKFYNFGAGPRWTMPGTVAGRSAIVPFAQIMLGAVRTDADLTLNGSRFNDADWAFMLQPGAGVTVPLTPALGVLGQVDYRRSFFETGENEFRFVIGVRVARR
jgi:hypothetical protein